MATAGRKNKVKKIGWRAEQIVLQDKARGKSYREIADKLSERFDVDISKNSVQNYYNSADESRARMAERNIGELEKEEVKKILDVESQLEELNEKLQEAIDELDATDRQDMGLLRQLAKEVRAQLEFQKKFQEEVLEKKTEINNYDIDNNVTAIEINRHLRELEDKGAIEIRDLSKLDM